MSVGWVAVGVTAVVGYYTNEQNKEASEEANATAKSIADSQLEFEMQQYAEWKDVYGELQEDLGTYFKNLNGKDYLPNELNAMQEQYDRSREMYQEQLTRRGMGNSGAMAEGLLELDIREAESRANSINTIDERIMEQKTQFLSLGLGQGADISDDISNTNTQLSNIALQDGATEIAYNEANADIIGNVVGAVSATYSSTDQQKISTYEYNQAEEEGLF